MRRFTALRILSDGPNRQLHDERGTLSLASAGSRNGPAMQFNQLAGDGQSQSETTVLSGPRLRLRKSFEDVRQKVRSDPNTRVADGRLHLRVRLPHRHS